jgi:hypothetical protein
MDGLLPKKKKPHESQRDLKKSKYHERRSNAFCLFGPSTSFNRQPLSGLLILRQIPRRSTGLSTGLHFASFTYYVHKCLRSTIFLPSALLAFIVVSCLRQSRPATHTVCNAFISSNCGSRIDNLHGELRLTDSLVLLNQPVGAALCLSLS